MASKQWIVLLLAGTLFVAAHVWWWRAMQNLSETGRARKWRIILWSKLFSGRDNFTDIGWRYWVRARWAALAFAVVWLWLGVAWASGAS